MERSRPIHLIYQRREISKLQGSTTKAGQKRITNSRMKGVDLVIGKIFIKLVRYLHSHKFRKGVINPSNSKVIRDAFIASVINKEGVPNADIMLPSRPTNNP